MSFCRSDIKTIKRMLFLLRDFKSQICIVCVLLLLSTFIFLYLPLLTKSIIDEGIIKKDIQHVQVCVTALIASALILGALDLIKEFVRSKMPLYLQQKLFCLAFDKLLHVKINYFETKNSSEILNDLDIDITSLTKICDDNIFLAFSQILMFVGGIIALIIINFKMAAVVFLFIPAKVVLIYFFNKKRKLIFNEIIKRNNDFAHWFGDNISGVKEIRLLGLYDEKENELKDKISYVAESVRNVTILDSAHTNADRFLLHIIDGILYLFGAVLIYNGNLSIGSLFAFVAYSMQVLSPISNILNISYAIVGIIPSANRFFSFIDNATQNSELSGKHSIQKITSIKFSKANFSHSNTKVLVDTTFTIKEGEKIAIIGNNGEGKSTILDLILGFNQLDSGYIYINDTKIHEYDIKSLRNLFCHASPTSYLFDKTIIDNIAINNSYETVFVNDYHDIFNIKEFSNVINDRIGENGTKLSAGQRQKIILSRLLALNKSYILLDEATSNLDYYSEQEFYKFFFTIFSNKTVIYITHDEHCLQFADSIIYIDSGAVTKFYSVSNFKESMQYRKMFLDENT